VVIDDRLVETMARHTEPALLLVFDRDPPAGAERLDSRDHWAGIARIPARTVARTAAGLGEWDLASTLVRVAVEAGVGRLGVSDLDTYAAERRRSLPFLWARPVDDAGCAAATGLLIASAQKGCLDWPARLLHPPVENAAVRLLLRTRVTPNQVTLATVMLGLGAIAAFATGWLWTGVILMLLVGPLDGVDGKLARVRAEYSRWGDLEHVADKLAEYGAYLALGWWFAGAGHGLGAWLAAGGIILFSLYEAVQGEFFRRFTGRQLDDWGPFERRFRLIAGRRNVYFWSVLPFFALNLWFEGYLMILGYAAVTFSVAEWRFLRAIREYAQRVDPRVGANFTDTAYDFLPKAGAGGR
jgi:phosphatidylglycerophosphate synthase